MSNDAYIDNGELPGAWWKQQDEEAESDYANLTDRSAFLRKEALAANGGEIQPAFGYLAMSVALLEADLQSRQNTIDHLKAVIKILERKS